ncbi:MAG: hypothetical protein HYY78_04635 [Betaproteobacteria bacterium]|nr:hypothetical protein [Betaproteobacteria bacterium]
MIVPFPPGGSVDVVMRTFGGRLAELTGQNVIIDNRPGGSGNVGANFAARAVPDGHTVLASTPEAFGKHLRAELGKWAKVVKEASLKAE